MLKLKMINNKRAQVAEIIFVLGVVALCIYALVSFFLSSASVNKNIAGTNIMEQINTKIEQYSFYKNTGDFTNDEIMSLLGVQADATGKKYLYAEQLDGNKKTIYVQYYLSN
jgi:hypothetical protein